MSFERDIKRVEEIAQKLGGSDTPLEEAITLYEEGIRLTKALEKSLDEAKRRIETVVGEELHEVQITETDE
jgi:exodeoxyribonuclease VII small subunit